MGGTRQVVFGKKPAFLDRPVHADSLLSEEEKTSVPLPQLEAWDKRRYLPRRVDASSTAAATRSLLRSVDASSTAAAVGSLGLHHKPVKRACEHNAASEK